MSNDEVKVASIILTKNEEDRIEGCLKRIHPYVDYILILDGESTDRTVEIARKYVDRVVVRPFSGSFAEEKNYARSLVPKDHLWILWVDADELFDEGFLKNMKKEFLENAEAAVGVCYRFMRVNLPDATNYPDYQVRLIKNSRDIEWRGKVHEVPYYIPEDTPLDQMSEKDRIFTLPVFTLLDFPILHLPRRKNEKRSWWKK